jgi:hypothetical protein
MVGEVECLRPEGQHVVVVSRDHMEVLVERGIPALESRAIDQVAAARGASVPAAGGPEMPWDRTSGLWCRIASTCGVFTAAQSWLPAPA